MRFVNVLPELLGCDHAVAVARYAGTSQDRDAAVGS